MYNLDYDIDKIIMIQKNIRNNLSIKNKLQNELDFILEITNKISLRVNNSYKKDIIKDIEYKELMFNLDKIIDNYYEIPNKLTLKIINEISKYKLIVKISKMKLECIKIIQKCGCQSIKDILKLTLNIDFNNLDNLYNKYINFYNKIFNPTGCDIYQSNNKDNISFTIYDKSNNNNITLTTSQVDYPSCNKLNIFIKSLIHKIYGSKIYFPFKSKLLVIYGYFIKDDLNIAKNNSLLKNKHDTLLNVFEQLDIPNSFKYNYLKQLSLKDFIILSEDIISNLCIEAYNDLLKIKDKNISILVKDFLINNSVKQHYYLTILVLDENDYDSHYLAHLLYDLIYSDVLINNADIYSCFHWSIQKLFINTKKNIEKINDKLLNYNEEDIPYEKRIYLMKTTNEIKSKALLKLKELNNSKGGETNAKVQQYIDGLLKVPFGLYKEESIITYIDLCYNKIKKCNIEIISILSNINNTYTLSDSSKLFCKNIYNLIENFEKNNKKPFIINQYIKTIKEIFKKNQLIELNKLNNFDIYLNSLLKDKLKEKCKFLDIKCYGNKNTLIKQILKYKIDFTLFHELFIDYISSQLNIDIKSIPMYYDLIKVIDNIETLIKEYKNQQKQYLKDVNIYLDKFVFGLKEPKKQINRIIAQWINGSNDGYVFGFEGPPGTGKTTLAKKGISMCLKDIDGNKRPFVFIALGGSSNGSTLEGHNYTYVGSTWGKIVEALMDSKCMNPIIYIDELDKISRTEQGKEIIGILTHLTDPSQNEEFTDKYFSGIKFDISKCLIIFSYNDPSLIDRILLDRIHRIKITGLNKNDKLIVVKKHLLPEICNTVGLDNDLIHISDSVLIHLIDTYTYEAGARKLKEKLFEIIREINLQYLNDEIVLPFIVLKDFIDDLLKNYSKISIKLINKQPKIGLINGLFATSIGIGGITAIEAYKNYSNSHLSLELTGQQGDVMKESMKVANTVAWNIINQDIKDKLMDKDAIKFGIHIHCPDGATPKDGPSAGTAIAICIISLLTGVKIHNEFGITGEIDLQGNCLKIGGLESKIDGAKAAGIKIVLCPISNKEDLIKIRNRNNPPEDENFKVILIENIYDAINHIMLFNNNKDKYIKSLDI
jgi:ATP-dependent Lon protease